MSTASAAPVIEQRSPATRLLIFGGILLILTGMLLGEIFAIFISHVAAAQIRREWTANMIPAIERQDLGSVRAAYSRIEDLLARRGRIMDTHSHMIAYGFLALALALLQSVNRSSEKTRCALALAIVMGGLIQSVSVFLSYWAAAPWHSLALTFSAIGGMSVFFGVLGTVAGLRDQVSSIDFAAEIGGLLSSASSQILLRAGAILILVGMVFGFYYAWVFVTQQEPRQIGLIGDALRSAMSRDSLAATNSIMAYRSLQSRIAIVTAAHSHVIEMGTMAILLAFVQNYVFLSALWKTRWAVLFCIGAAIMPICTYTASILGLVAAGFADTFGMLSVIALFAMLCGLVRQTGVDDRRCAI